MNTSYVAGRHSFWEVWTVKAEILALNQLLKAVPPEGARTDLHLGLAERVLGLHSPRLYPTEVV